MMKLRAMGAAAAALILGVGGAGPAWAGGKGTGPAAPQMALPGTSVAALHQTAERTWRFFQADANPVTHLPMDSISAVGGLPNGAYTSPTDIAMYIWGVTAARDMHLVSGARASALVGSTLAEVERLQRWHGFLLSWYDTTTGAAITGPGGSAIPAGSLDGQFISTVDNGWYASSLVVVRQAYPALAARAGSLLSAMDFGRVYDASSGQMYGGYTVGQGPTSWTYGLLNTETRIAAYMGIGTHTVPGTVWWDTFRTLPASYTWQTASPQGHNVTYFDPQSGKLYTVFEGHYTYGGIGFVPSWGGSEFEGLMNNLIVPETSWGPASFGMGDRNYAIASAAYATDTLGYKVWGLSPASTPDDTGGYAAYGAVALGSNAKCCAYQTGAVSPYASFLALPVIPRRAYRNIATLRSAYPGSYGAYGFFDSLNPTTGQVSHRYLVLDQGMVMAGLDVVLSGGGLQRYFAADPVGKAVRPYLGVEHFSITPAD